MKRTYNKPDTTTFAIDLCSPMLTMSEGETTTIGIDPGTGKDPSDALSRRRNVWDDEDEEL